MSDPNNLVAPRPRRVMEIDKEALKYGVCVWQLPNGGYVRDEYGNYFNAMGRVDSRESRRKIEQKMRDAVKHLDANMWPGLHDGKPFWLPGFRKISDSEWEDQMEMLLDGYANPDPVDTARQLGAGI